MNPGISIKKSIFFDCFGQQKEASDGRWWRFEPYESNHSFVQVTFSQFLLLGLCAVFLTLRQRWEIFMLLPLSYEMWAFPYRLALGVPAIR
jgi:hypothetical protein